MLIALLDAIGDKEGFVIRCGLAFFCTIVSGGFYSAVFPFMTAGIHALIILLIVMAVAIVLMFLSRSLATDFYFSKARIFAIVLPILIVLLIVGSLFSLGVFIAS
jgi:hypothetical protein